MTTSSNFNLQKHYAAEESSLHQLLKLENEFREHYALMLKEMLTQKELIARLWVLSQRYLQIISTGPCCKYPDIYSTPAEEVIVTEYNEKLKQLHTSNCHIMKSIYVLRLSCRAFEKICSQLDMTVESPFMLGDAMHKPIAFFIELVSDCFKYMHAIILKFKYCANQLDPGDCSGLEEYKKLLTPSLDFEEYLMVGLTYCRCLRPIKKLC